MSENSAFEKINRVSFLDSTSPISVHPIVSEAEKYIYKLRYAASIPASRIKLSHKCPTAGRVSNVARVGQTHSVIPAKRLSN